MGSKYLLKIVSVVCIAIMCSTILFTGEAKAGPGDRFNMSYIYFGDTGAYSSIVESTEDSLDDISPSYFDLYEDGSLNLTQALDPDFISEMHGKGIKVTPFLSNHWDRQSGINALANRDSLAAQIADAVEEYDLDGVNVDLENLTGNERDDYTDFVKILRNKLPSGKSLSIAVAPKPYAVDAGWSLSYDYAGLSKYCDYLMLMTYDEHYQGGPEGPVASAQFVEDSIKKRSQGSAG